MASHDLFLLECPSYEDYLDSFVLTSDLRYLRNIRSCRLLVSLGYRSSAGIYTPAQFDMRKAAAQEMLSPTKKSSMLFSDKLKIYDPILIELANRERPNVQKIISTILFVRMRRKSGFEISGYIDFEQSLRRANLRAEGATDWFGVFRERCLVRPKPTDLSFFDWHTGAVLYNESDNFIVLHDIEFGLIFMHKGDHKKVCVDVSREQYSSNCTRTMHFSERFGHFIIYDHIVRKKI